MTEDDAPVASTRGPGGLDELLLTQREELRPNDSGERAPEERSEQEGQRQRLVTLEDLAQRGGSHDRHRKQRQAQDQVGEAHERGVDPTAVVAGDSPDQSPETGHHQPGQPGDGQAGAAAVDDAREDVPPEVVGAEPEAATGRQQVGQAPCAVVDPLQRIRQRQEVGQHRRGDDDQQDEHRHHGKTVPHEPRAKQPPLGEWFDGYPLGEVESLVVDPAARRRISHISPAGPASRKKGRQAGSSRPP